MHFSPSDANLLKQTLFCDDPLGQPDLIDYIPDGIEAVRILNRYNYRAEHLRCAYCGRALHFKGVTVELDNGKRVLVGHVCGRERWHRSWDEINEEFRRKEQRRRYLVKVAPVARVIDELVAGLETWRQPVTTFETIRGGFKTKLQRVYTTVEEAFVKREGKLMLLKRQRDLTAEHRRAETRPDEKNDEPIYKNVEVVFARLVGSGVIAPNVKVTLAEVIAEFNAVKKAIEKKCALSDAELARVVKAISNARRTLPRIKGHLDDLWRFSQPANLCALVDYLNKKNDAWHRYAYKDSAIKLVSEWDAEDTLVYVPFLTDPLQVDLDVLAILEKIEKTANSAANDEDGEEVDSICAA